MQTPSQSSCSTPCPPKHCPHSHRDLLNKSTTSRPCSKYPRSFHRLQNSSQNSYQGRKNSTCSGSCLHSYLCHITNALSFSCFTSLAFSLSPKLTKLTFTLKFAHMISSDMSFPPSGHLFREAFREDPTSNTCPRFQYLYYLALYQISMLPLSFISPYVSKSAFLKFPKLPVLCTRT